MRVRYFWMGMIRDVRLAVRLCPRCLVFRKQIPEPHAALHPVKSARPFEFVAMDIVRGGNYLPTMEDGNKYILTIIDLFTRWAEAIPLRNQKVDTIPNSFVHHGICRHDAPYRLLTDQGRNLHGKLFASVCDFLRSDKV